MITEFYLAIGVALFVWCYLLDRNFPGPVTYLEAAQIIFFLVLGWPFLIKIIVELTREAFEDN